MAVWLVLILFISAFRHRVGYFSWLNLSEVVSASLVIWFLHKNKIMNDEYWPEFLIQGDLMFHMQRQRRLPEEHARFYAAEISVALNFLHCKGTYVHTWNWDRIEFKSKINNNLHSHYFCRHNLPRFEIGQRAIRSWRPHKVNRLWNVQRTRYT